MLKFNEFIKEKYENQFFIETGTSKYELLMIENEVISKIDNLLDKEKSTKEEEPETKNPPENKAKPKLTMAKVYEYFKKAIKALGIVTVMGAAIYIGFRFDFIRKMFPFLAPFIDAIGSKTYEFLSKWTGNFGYDAFVKLMNLSKDFAIWLVTKASDMLGITPAIKKAMELLGMAQDKALDVGDDVSSYLKGGTSQYDNPDWTRDSVYSKSPTYDDAGKLLPKDQWKPWSYDSRSIYPTTPKIDTNFPSPEGLADRFNKTPSWMDDIKKLK
jgi:hypothetical protein